LLTVITGYSGLIKSGLAPEHPLQNDVRQIMLSTERAIGLTAQLLALGRKEAGAPEPLDLNAVLEDVMPLARRLVGEKIRCVVEASPVETLIKADRGQIETAIINLCAHARERMAGVGTIRIRVSEIAATGRPGSEFGLPAGAYVSLALSDTGPAVSEEERPHLFEPFFERPDAGPKSGLLLATVYAIMQQHGGAIFCDNAPGHGCTFRVCLPRLERAVGPKPVARPVLPSRERGVVLVVEDEEVLRDFALLILGRGGFTAIGAADGLEALEVLRQRREPVDLIFTDVVMPRMGGAELARQLDSLRPNTPILFTSGYPKSILTGSVNANKRLEFLQKPYTTQGLLDRVRELIGAPVTE
jgi:two-component system, cell cycle sensor histidine kinase and response regulator CckA